MCGRYSVSSPRETIAKYFDAKPEASLAPSYNVAPTSDVYVVLEEGGVRHLDAFRWGLLPVWAKHIKQGARMINARAESLTDSNAFKRAFARRRCLLPADGFYEWRKLPDGKRKQPYFIRRKDGDPIALAGLWEEWRGPDRQGEPVHTCTIITTTANETMASIHNRMPVILPPSAWDAWLDPTNDDIEALAKLLVPAPAELLVAHPVSTAVNNVRNDSAELIIEATADQLVS